MESLKGYIHIYMYIYIYIHLCMEGDIGYLIPSFPTVRRTSQ